MFAEGVPVIVVYFVAVTVPFVNGFLFVQLVCLGRFIQDTGVGTKAQCTADIFYSVLIRHQGNDRMGGVGVQLNTVGVVHSADMTGKFHNGKLHSQTQAQERDAVLTGILDSAEFAVNATVSETAGHKNSLDAAQNFIYIVVVELFRIHPFDINSGPLINTAVF